MLFCHMRKSHKQQVLEILQDYRPHRTDEITRRMFGSDETIKTGLFRLASRISDLKKEGYKIKGDPDPVNSKLYWYQLIPEIPPYTEEAYNELLKKYLANWLNFKKNDKDPKPLLEKLARTKKAEEQEALKKRIFYKLFVLFREAGN